MAGGWISPEVIVNCQLSFVLNSTDPVPCAAGPVEGRASARGGGKPYQASAGRRTWPLAASRTSTRGAGAVPSQQATPSATAEGRCRNAGAAGRRDRAPSPLVSLNRQSRRTTRPHRHDKRRCFFTPRGQVPTSFAAGGREDHATVRVVRQGGHPERRVRSALSTANAGSSTTRRSDPPQVGASSDGRRSDCPIVLFGPLAESAWPTS
jgi:hypothetical protein